jgi:hypothetical protein
VTAADRLATLCWRSGYDLTCWVEGYPDGATTTTTADPRWYVEVIRPPKQGIGRYGATLDEAAALALAELEVTP